MSLSTSDSAATSFFVHSRGRTVPGSPLHRKSALYNSALTKSLSLISGHIYILIFVPVAAAYKHGRRDGPRGRSEVLKLAYGEAQPLHFLHHAAHVRLGAARMGADDVRAKASLLPKLSGYLF